MPITKEQVHKYYLRYKHKRPAIARAYYKRCKDKFSGWFREAALMRRYGLTIAAWDAMYEKQGGVCAICRRKNKNGQRLVVDHSHKTGHIRGLLCHNCNLTLGKFDDNTDWFLEAAMYVTKAREL